jgi:CRISPR-associated protein Csx17
MANVLARRMMDGARAGCERLPLAARCTVPLEHVAAFIAGDLDDKRIEQLIWGLMLVDMRDAPGGDRAQRAAGHDAGGCSSQASAPLPRDYALLKLLFLPRPLVPERSGGDVRWRLARPLADGRLEAGLVIRPEPRILPLLRAGRVGEACRIAAQRLRASGLPPMPGPLPTGVMRDDGWSERTMDPRYAQRLAAALLVPVSSKSVDRLIHLVCRADDSAAAEASALSQEGESK